MSYGHAQFKDRHWCFGDSSSIDFTNLSSPVADTSILRVRGTCASISDSVGNLLFYAASPNIDIWLQTSASGYGYIVNKNHQIMDRGDSLSCALWYQEMTIIPNPA